MIRMAAIILACLTASTVDAWEEPAKQTPEDTLPQGILARLGSTHLAGDRQVIDLCFAGNDQGIVVVTGERELSIFSRRDFSLQKKLKHPQEVCRAAASSLGNLAVACRAQKPSGKPHVEETGKSTSTLTVWSADLTAVIATIACESTSELEIAWSPDGSVLAIGRASSNSIWLWSLLKQRTLNVLNYDGYLRQMAWSRDGKRLAASVLHSRDRASVLVWLRDGHLEQEVEAGVGEPLCLVFAPDGKNLAIGLGRSISSDDPLPIIIWNLEKKSKVGQLLGHSQTVYSLSFSPNGERLWSASRDGTLREWNWALQQELRQLTSSPNAFPSRIVHSQDGKTLLTIKCLGPASWVVVWDLKNEIPQLPPTPQRHRGPLRSVSFSADHTRLLSFGEDTQVIDWDIASGEPKCVLTPKGARQAEYLPIRDSILVANETELSLFSCATSKPITQPFRISGSQLTTFAIAPDGGRIAVGERRVREEHDPRPDEGTITILDSNTFRVIDQFACYEVDRLAFSPSGRLLANIGQEPRIRIAQKSHGREPPREVATIWRLDNLNQVATIQPPFASTSAPPAFTTAETELLIPTFDKYLCRRWNFRTGGLETVGDGLRRQAICLDSQFIAYGIAPKILCIRSTDVEHISFYSEDVSSFTRIAVSPDRTRLAQSLRSGTVLIWDLKHPGLQRVQAGRK